MFYLLSFFEVLLQRCAELLGIFDKLLFALLHSLLARDARYKRADLVDHIEQFLYGAGDFSVGRKGITIIK